MEMLEDSPPTPQSKPDKAAFMGLFAALILGGALRFYPAVTHSFPLGDGGLFLLMTQAVRDNSFALPKSIYYPTVSPSIPFCYPPLAFYGAAFLNLFGFSFETLFRFLPAFWATACIYAFWLLAKAVLETLELGKQAAGMAALLWALIPWSYVWLIMGGGLTRAPGTFFALLGAATSVRLWRDRESRQWWSKPLLGTTLCFALSLLTHLERAHFLALTLVLCWAVYGRSWRTLGQLASIFLGGLILGAPWWGLCLSRFGVGPFLNAFRSGGAGWPKHSLAENLFRAELFFPLVTLIGLVGALRYARRLPLLPLWIGLILLVEVRSAVNFTIMPLAIAAGLLIVSMRPAIVRAGVAAVAILWLLFQSTLLSLHYTGLSNGRREAMEWVSVDTPEKARFLVVRREVQPSPMNDDEAEWFPALAGRASLNTVQGTEWLPDNAFAHQYARYTSLSDAMAKHDLNDAMARLQIAPDWLYVVEPETGTSTFKPRSPAKGFVLVLQTPGASVWKRAVLARQRLLH